MRTPAIAVNGVGNLKRTHSDGFAFRKILGSKLDTSVSLMQTSYFDSVQHRLDADGKGRRRTVLS